MKNVYDVVLLFEIFFDSMKNIWVKFLVGMIRCYDVYKEDLVFLKWFVKENLLKKYCVFFGDNLVNGYVGYIEGYVI